MKRPIYFVTRYHKDNYFHLVQKTANPKAPHLIAATYILGAIGTLDDSPGQIANIEPHVSARGIDFASILIQLKPDREGFSLAQLAANLFDGTNPADVTGVFSPLGDEYQAVAYQGLLVKFPSFSKSWERRFDYEDYRKASTS
jgi:hypothetical protein